MDNFVVIKAYEQYKVYIFDYDANAYRPFVVIDSSYATIDNALAVCGTLLMSDREFPRLPPKEEEKKKPCCKPKRKRTRAKKPVYSNSTEESWKEGL